MADGTASEEPPSELQSALLTEDEVPSSFYKGEVKEMCKLGWPLLVSFFCRFGMASEDNVFVGHISKKLATLGQTDFDSYSVINAATRLVTLTSVTFAAAEAGYGPKQYLAAAGLSDMLTNIFIIPPLAFNQSLNALVSQSMGSGNKKMAGTWLQLSVISFTIAHVPMLVPFFFVSPLLQLLGFDETICSLAGNYAMFNAFWPIPNGLYQCMRFYFQAQGLPRPAMYNNILFLFINAFFNWLFVFGGPFRLVGWKGFGFIGAAMSLSFSRSLQPVTYWLYMFLWKKSHLETWPSWSEKTFMKKEHIKSFMAMSLPQIGSMIFQAVTGQATTLLIAKLGAIAIAAGTATSTALMIFANGVATTIMFVSAIRVGFFLGKGQSARARAVSNLSIGLGFAVNGVLGMLLIVFARPLMHGVTSDPSVQKAAVAIMPAQVVNMIASCVVGTGTSGILTSQGRTKAVACLSFGFELPFSIGSVALLVLVFKADLVTVFWGQAAVSAFEMVVVLAILQRSDWALYAREAQERQGAVAPEDTGPEEAPHNASVLSLQPQNTEDKVATSR